MTNLVGKTSDSNGLREALLEFKPYFKDKIEDYKEFELGIKKKDSKLTLICYKNKKIQVQFSEKTDFSDILGVIKKYSDIDYVVKTMRPELILKDYVIGIDEAGWGECFGSIFVSVVRIKKDVELSKFDVLKGKDIKDLSEKEINYYYSLIEADSNIHKISIPISAVEIDYSGIKVQRLKDKAFVKGISDTLLNSNTTIIIDDYGILDELNAYLSKLKETGCEIVLEHDADKNYIYCQIASIVAKKERMDEVNSIANHKENILLDENMNEIKIKEGSSHPETIKWLEIFKKTYQDRPIPDFFRRCWGNVRRICENHPKRLESFIVCPICKSSLKKVYLSNIRILGIRYRFLFCPECESDLSCSDLDTKNLYYIMPDTSSLIDAVFKTDFTYKNSIFRGKKFIISSLIDKEISTKSIDLRNAGLKQIEEISRKHQVLRQHYTFASSLKGISFVNDEKLLGLLCSKRNVVLVTKDNTFATSAVSSGEFVIHVIETNSLQKIFKRFTTEKIQALLEKDPNHKGFRINQD